MIRQKKKVVARKLTWGTGGVLRGISKIDRGYPQCVGGRGRLGPCYVSVAGKPDPLWLLRH